MQAPAVPITLPQRTRSSYGMDGVVSPIVNVSPAVTAHEVGVRIKQPVYNGQKIGVAAPHNGRM